MFAGDCRLHALSYLPSVLGGMFALGAHTSPLPSDSPLKKAWFKRGANVTATCRKSYASTKTRVGPDKMQFSATVDAAGVQPNERTFLQRPETVESYFVLWRLTKDPKYREWAWDAAQVCLSYGNSF